MEAGISQPALSLFEAADKTLEACIKKGAGEDISSAIYVVTKLRAEAEKEKERIVGLYKDGKIDSMEEPMRKLAETLNNAAFIVADPTGPDALKALQNIHKNLPKEDKMTTMKALQIALIVTGVAIIGVALAFTIIGVTHGTGFPIALAILKGLNTAVLPYLVSSGAWAHLGGVMHVGMSQLANTCYSGAAHYVFGPVTTFASQLYSSFMALPAAGKAVAAIGAAFAATLGGSTGYYGAKFIDETVLGNRQTHVQEKDNRESTSKRSNEQSSPVSVIVTDENPDENNDIGEGFNRDSIEEDTPTARQTTTNKFKQDFTTWKETTEHSQAEDNNNETHPCLPNSSGS